MKIIDQLMIRMSVAGFFCLLFLAPLSLTCAAQPRDPRAEIEVRKSRFSPPPVNEAAASRAEKAAHAGSRRASIGDQVELAIKRGNAARERLDKDFRWALAVPGPAYLTEDDKRALAQAESYYQRAVELNPKEWRGFSALGGIYSDWGRYTDAARAYEQASALRPREADLQKLLGDAYQSDKKSAEAAGAYARSIELDPSSKNEHAYFGLAIAYSDAGLLDKAIQTYKRLLVIKPDATEHYSRIADLYDYQGDTYTMLKQFSKAISAYQDELQFTPDRSSAIMKLGEGFLEIHDLNSAREKQKEIVKYDRTWANTLLEHIKLKEEIESDEQTLRANPSDVNAHYKMGNAYFAWKGGPSYFGKNVYKAGDFVYRAVPDHYAEAIEQYKETIRLEPNSPEAHFNLGLAYLYNGNKSAAMEQYRALKELKPDYAEELLNAINKR